MTNQIKPYSYNRQKHYLPIVFLIYALCAVISGYAYRFAMNPDGTSVLRLAAYIAEGHFQRSVTTGYSPFMIWLISPLIFFGVDALAAARIVIALSGAGLLYFCWLMALRFDLPQHIRFIAALTAAPLISFWTIQFVSPDVLFAALTLCYLYAGTNQDILNRKKLAFVCGVIGGLTYFAHHYGMPFFLVHFPALLLARGYMDRENGMFPWKKIFISWAAGVAGFVMVASLWVGTVSVKYGELALSPKGSIAHAVMGPKDKDRRHPFFAGGLFKTRDDYALHVFEDPTDVTFATWSPFESKEYFIHQLKLIKVNAVYILNHFVTQSPFFTRAFVVFIIVLIPVVLLLDPMNRKHRFLYAWVTLTFAVYCSGFLLIMARSPRRFYALMLLFLLASFHFIGKLKNTLQDCIPEQRKKLFSVYLLAVLVAAFAIKPGVHLLKSAKQIITVDQVNPYKEIAGRISTIDFPAPYAVIRSSQKATTDYYMTYFLKKKLLGRPLSGDVEGITEELMSAGGKSLLIFDHPELSEKVRLDGRYVYLGSVKLNNGDRYEKAVKWSVAEHEVISGWDDKVDIFTLK